MRWSEEAWMASEGIFRNILGHPFITEMASGELHEQRFMHYIAQDEIYLREYAETLALLAAKIEDADSREMFSQCSIDALEGEKSMHTLLIGRFGGVPADDISSVTRAYNSHARQAVERGKTFGLAATLPCDWVYNEVGHHMLRIAALEGNPYREWIEQYDSPAYTAIVRKMIHLADVWADVADERTRAQMTEIFVRSVQYEYDFWEYAYKITER